MTKTIDLESITLKAGAHGSPDEGMCVVEAISVAAGEEFSDHPPCTSPVIASFLRSWNDALNDEDRQQLKPYILTALGTNKGSAVDVELSWMALDWLIRVQTPAWLKLAGLTEQATILTSMAEVTPTSCPSILPALQAVRTDARAARDAARAAAGDAARAAAWDAARAAAWAAARDAARAAARDAARDAAWAAARDAARAAAGDAARAAAWAAARAAAWDAARAAARDAAWAALRPTVVDLQAEAHLLVGRLIEHAKAAA